MKVDKKSLSCASLALCALLVGCQDEEATNNKFTGNMVLAISWQPGFCETRPRLRECRSQTKNRYDAVNFSLHGLWPQPGSAVYCGVAEDQIRLDKSRRWKRLEGLGLSETVKEQLWKIMPGARSYLHRHEWVKHGTCYSAKPETYYVDSLRLMDQINASSVQDLFERSVGKPLSNGAIRSAFDRAFGEGVGQRVRVACKRDGSRTIITELTLGLSGEITDKPDIKSLALASPKTKRGCPSGIVDPVGFQ